MVFFILILFLYFRQVDPSPNNAAARSLSEEIQQRNIRRVKVNAQVAFAIYVVEVLGGFSMIFLWLFFRKSVFAKIASTLLYYVLLPYIYLMNTANNKIRITDDGWTSTVRNALGISTNTVTELEPFRTQEETSNMLTSRSRPNASKKYVSTMKRNKIGIGQIDRDKQKLGIYTISYNTKETQTCEFHTENPITALNVKACSSSALSKPPQKQNRERCLQMSVPHRDDSDDDSPIPQKSRYFQLAEYILSKMMTTINEEDAYIHYLKQLLFLENKAMLGDFEILEFNDTLARKHRKVKTTKQTPKLTDNHDQLKHSKNKMPQLVELNVKFLGRQLDRVDLRKSLFENFHDHCKDDKTYKIFFNKLFDFEESLIMDNVRANLEYQ